MEISSVWLGGTRMIPESTQMEPEKWSDLEHTNGYEFLSVYWFDVCPMVQTDRKTAPPCDAAGVGANMIDDVVPKNLWESGLH
jgi:hypothetical protein